MKKFLFLFIITCLGLKVKSQLSYQWAGSAGSAAAEFGKEITTDPSGNVYVIGSFSSTVDFDPGPGTATLSAVSGSDDIFLAKYSSSGAFLWVKQIGSSSTEKPYDVVADATGAYVAGTFMSTCNFNIGGVASTLTSLGGGTDGDGFFAKYDVTGNLTWVDRIGSSVNDRVMGIALDGSSNVYVTGFIGGNADMDPGAPVVTLSVSGTFNAYIGKYTSAGAYVYAKQITGAYSDAYDISLDGTGNIYLTGSFGGTNDFDPAPGFTTNLSTSGTGQIDIYFAEYTNAGIFTLAKQIGGLGIDIGFQIMPDASGNIYLAGEFSSTCDFNPAPGFTNNIVSAGSGDLFVAKYDASGSYLWANGIGGSSLDYAFGMGLDASSNVYITGYYNGANIDFDPGMGVAALTSTSSSFYLASYNSAGTFNFVYSLGNINSAGNGLEVNSSLYATGMFASTADFDFGVPTATITSAGGSDVFFSKYNLCVGVAPAQPGAIAGNTTMCTGSSQTYSVVNDPLAANYSWSLPGGWTGTSTTNIITTTVSASGTISVVANGTCGASASQTLAVTVNTLPVITAVANPTSICVGQTSSTITTGGAVSYTTQPGNLTGSVVVVSPGALTIYTVSGINANSCTNTKTVQVGINPSVTASANNPSVCINGSLIFSSSGGGTYSWAGPNSFTSAIQNPTIAVAQVTNSGQYTVTITGALGCTASAVSSATVFPVPSPTIAFNNPVCNGGPLVFTVTGAAGSFSWTGPNSFTSAIQNPTILNVQLVNAGSYSLLVTAGTCTGSTTASININASPNVSVSASNTLICVGETATLNASGANTYSWSSGGNTANEIISPTVTTNYTVVGTAVNNCTNSIVITQSVSLCTELSEQQSLNSELKIYPNPFTNEITISVSDNKEVTKFTVINTLGQIVFIKDVPAANLILSDLPKGIYFAKIDLASGRQKNIKIVKE